MNEDELEATSASMAAQSPRIEYASHTSDALRMAPKPARRPPVSARCAACAAAELSSLPTFSAGSGVASRPFAEDVICHGCGHIGPPALVPD